jgi:hypothetical protein
MASASGGDFKGVLKEVWLNESILEQYDQIGEYVTIPVEPEPKRLTYTLHRGPWHKRLRAKARRKAQDAREAVALRIAPWLDYHDDDW